ncbi:hypothetical protein [Microcoleus sp. CAWBG58]|uniref:hypothetical protein n=1 Tax=Microcoleus sp. CAWBG58 TaxID=2841651 RepID=UPI0025EF609B|nr:hypothetical protein [Microcoleus sp. CAWBG58]
MTATKTKETGFFAVFRLCIDILEKNPVSASTQNLRNRVFDQISDCNQGFWKKPGFSPHHKSKTTTKTKETGFFVVFRWCIDILAKNPVSASTQNLRNRVFDQISDCDRLFWKKPGFSPPHKSKTTTKTKETGFFAVFRLCIDILAKNPVSASTQNLRNRVFGQISDCNEGFSKKTRFLATPHIQDYDINQRNQVFRSF